MKLTQLLASFYGCGPALDDEARLIAVLHESAERVGAVVVEEARVRYAPHGLTVAMFLAESHALLSTWPEHRLALLDVLLCNDRMDPKVFLDRAERVLEPRHGTRCDLVTRDVADVPDTA